MIFFFPSQEQSVSPNHTQQIILQPQQPVVNETAPSSVPVQTVASTSTEDPQSSGMWRKFVTFFPFDCHLAFK